MKILIEISGFVLKYRQYKNTSSDSTKYIGVTMHGRITNPYTLEMEKIGKQATGWKQFPREILLCFIIGNGGLYHKNERKNKIG